MRDDLTVVIPTKQRARYVERVLGYLAAGGLRARVLVADASTSGHDTIKAAVARANAHFQCEYLEYQQPITMYKKCYEALRLVKTPLVALLADDDFVVPATLHAAAERLLADPSISIAHGAAMSLSMDHGPGIDPMQTVRSRSRKHLVAEHDSALDRVCHYLRDYASIFYSVARQEQLTSNFMHMSELNQDYDFGQTMCGCLSLAQGKAVAVDGLYYVVMDTAIGTSRTSSNLMMGWPRLLTSHDYSQRYAQFKTLVLGELERTCPRDVAEHALDAAFVDYLAARLVTKPVGEFDRLRRAAGQAGQSIARLGAIASRGLQTMVQEPAAMRELKSPREALSRWARALDPLSLEALKESNQKASINQVLSAIESYPG